MSWADKRISLPSFLHGQSGLSSSHLPGPSETPVLSPTGSNNINNAAPRNSSGKSVVLSAHLRKLKKNKVKWFVLYEDEPGDPGSPAHLEYHDDDKKWRAGFPPKRKIVLNKCLNICRKQDSRDSKNKQVIALYTLQDCVGLLFEQEEELRIWLDLLLSHQQGRNSNGKIPKPNYEHMWQVKVRHFQPESKNSQFTMTGVHRLCVTPDDVKFFPVGSGEPIVFPVDCIRNCATVNRLFRLEAGRSSVSGPGLLVIECEDKEIANKINIRVLSSMRESELDQHGCAGYNSSTGCRGSGCSRPRSESWSNHEKLSLPSSAPSYSKFPLFKEPPASKSASSSSSNMRHRTTSEGGGHFENFQKSRRNLISGSPNGPGSSFLCSSESAGSSNSLEESLQQHEGSKVSNHGFSMTPDGSNQLTESTIYEESSGESAQDVDRSAVMDISLPPSEDYMDMSSVQQAPPPPLSSAFQRVSLDAATSPISPNSPSSYPHTNTDEEDSSSVSRRREDMAIPLSENDFSSSYVTMSPVSLDIDKLKSIEEEESVFSVRSRSKNHPTAPSNNPHHRNSYCSSTTEEPPRWSPGLGDPYSSPHLPIDPDFPMDPDSNYVPLDFGMIDHRLSRRRISPASSCSIISAGTPSSAELLHQPDKVVSQILRDDEFEDLLPHANSNAAPPRTTMRAYSIGSRPPLPGKSPRNGGGPPTRFIDIPSNKQSSSSSSSLNNNPQPPHTGGGWLKQSPGGSSTGHSPSSSIMSWIRQRTGSVPSRPPFFERRRHRTQSEGEKDDV
eukprot:TRINITY_DN2762_c0_g1_i2.p1 TRINITY_DN2762_c0_g1~~TRINITY_DN2762_c0_g1_i2.p1  ORF type:complete len:783 (+),score=271.02 TRINITY_DN2762_c0_g1_i2:104-2452(+)